MNKKDLTIILGTAHRKREPGKQSPDGRLREYQYSREIVSEIVAAKSSLTLRKKTFLRACRQQTILLRETGNLP